MHGCVTIYARGAEGDESKIAHTNCILSLSALLFGNVVTSSLIWMAFYFFMCNSKIVLWHRHFVMHHVGQELTV